MSSSIAETAGAARQRLASSLGALQQDANLPAQVLDIVSGLARAMGPLFQVERSTGSPELLYTARAVLQETLGRMQTVDNTYPGVADATAAIAQSLGMIFAAIKEHNVADPAAPRPAADVAPPQPAAQAAPPPPAAQPAPPPPAAPPAAQPVPLVQPAAQPVPLVQPAAQPVPLVQPAAQPVPLVQQPAVAFAPTAAAPVYASPAPAAPPAKHAPAKPAMPAVPSMLPETAAVVPTGPNGLPRLEAVLDVHSDTNFYTNFLGDIRDHGGIFVATFAILNIGTQCEVQLTFPGELTADLRGVVRWRREPQTDGTTNVNTEPGLGVEITHAAGDGWALIERFIKKREPIIHEV